MSEEALVYEPIYQQYLQEIAALDLAERAARLGLEMQGDAVRMTLGGERYMVSGRAIEGPLDGEPPSRYSPPVLHACRVILCKHLIMAPAQTPPDGSWRSYREFPDTAPYRQGFVDTAERPVMVAFSGRAGKLDAACRALGGLPPEEGLSYDVCLAVPVLPRVPLLLLFNDQEDGFPAHCSMLMRQSAADYLDTECMAIVGMVLAQRLKTVAASLD